MKPALKQHEFKAEWVEDEHGEGVTITQADGWGDESPTVMLHPWQLRSICEHFQIIEGGDEAAAREIAALKRRMVVLRDRLLDLHGYMCRYSDHKHADLTYEVTNLTALVDIAAEWCADFEEPPAADSDQYAPVRARAAVEAKAEPHPSQPELI